MTLREAMRAFLLGATTVPGLLGQPDGGFVARVPPGAVRPYFVIHTPGGDPAHMHLGGAAPFGSPLLTVECYGDSIAATEALANSVDMNLNAYRGPMGDLWVHACIRRDRRGPVAEDRQDGSADPIYVVQLDYGVSHRT